MRTASALALALMEDQARHAVPALMQLLDPDKEKEPLVVAAVMYTLGEIGQPARPAIPALERVVKNEEEALKRVAQEAIDKINDWLNAADLRPNGGT